jgi:hypothetical protein
MLKKFSIGFVLLGWLAGRLVPAPAAAQTLESKTLGRTVDGVVVTGDLLPEFIGVPLEQLRVYAEVNGALQVIPFQADELAPDRSAFILPQGAKSNRTLSDGVFSVQDEVAFMAKDLGGKVPRSAWPQGALHSAEIEVIDPLDLSRGWAYLFAFPAPPALSPRDYVAWDAAAGEVRTAAYLNGYPPGAKAIYFSRIAGRSAEYGSGVDYVDRMKLRFHFVALWGLVSFDGTEDSAGQRIVGEKDGPVRVLRRGMVYYQLPFGIKYNAGGTLQIYWEGFGQGPVELDMPGGVTAVLRSAMMISCADLSPEAYGMRFYTDKDLEGVLIDGKMSEKEKALDPTGSHWNLITGAQGSLLQRAPSNVPVLPREDNYQQWIDDASQPDPPEEFPGRIGCLVSYFNLAALPKGHWRSAALFYTPPRNFDPKRVPEYLRIEDHPLVLRVGDKIGRSHILPWHPTLPEDYYRNYQPLPGEKPI